MPTYEELLKEKIKRLDTIGEKFAGYSKQVQKTMLKNAITKLDSLARDKAGNIIANASNLNKINSIVDTVKVTLEGDEYQSLVSGLLNEMDKQALINDKLLKLQFDELTDNNFDFANALLRKIQATTEVNLLDVSTANISNGLNQYLNTAISGGASYKDVQEYVQDYLIGAEGKDGSLVRYTRQIANDGFAISDRSRIKVVSESFGAEFYRYQGGTIDTTRCFCEERNGKIFHIKEIQAWGDGEITMGELSSECGYPWAGMNSGTNSGNIMDLLGGYNCLHSLMPVSEIDVPTEVLRRAMEEGFYEPSDTVRELLGL